MNEDQYWLAQQRDRFAEEIQRSRLSLAEALEYRQETGAIWNDSCAQDVRSRFLGPMEDGATASLAALRAQYDALTLAAKEIVAAHDFFMIASDASIAMIRPTEETRAAFRAIESFLNQEATEIAAADAQTNESVALTKEADQVGNSTPTQREYRG